MKLKYWNKDEEKRTSALKNKIFKKTWKSFGGSKKSLTFASAFRKKAVKEEFFERFRYKQASSTSFVWKMTKTETVNT